MAAARRGDDTAEGRAGALLEAEHAIHVEVLIKGLQKFGT